VQFLGNRGRHEIFAKDLWRACMAKKIAASKKNNETNSQHAI
jgi:hypothetical protein